MTNAKSETTEPTDGEPADDHIVRVHTEIGNRPGAIVELRPGEHADDPPAERDMTHLSESDARDLRDRLNAALEPHAPETKIVRVHEPDKGQYVYVMMTRFNGEDAPLGREGWRGDYIWYSTVSRNEQANVSGADPWALARRHPGDWFPESAASALMKDLDMDRTEWSDLSDGDKLTPEDVAALADDADDSEVESDD